MKFKIFTLFFVIIYNNRILTEKTEGEKDE